MQSQTRYNQAKDGWPWHKSVTRLDLLTNSRIGGAFEPWLAPRSGQKRALARSCSAALIGPRPGLEPGNPCYLPFMTLYADRRSHFTSSCSALQSTSLYCTTICIWDDSSGRLDS